MATPTPIPSVSNAALERAFYTQDSRRAASIALALARRGHGQVLQSLREHPLADEWHEFLVAALKQHFERSQGFVYVAANPVHCGFYKVGQTRLDPEFRMAALNNEAVIGAFELVHSWVVYDRHYLESAAHQALSGAPRHKEFFHCSWREACLAVAQVVQRDALALARAGITVPELAALPAVAPELAGEPSLTQC